MARSSARQGAEDRPARVLIDDFHHIRYLTAPLQPLPPRFVCLGTPSPRVRCRKALVAYLLTYAPIAYRRRFAPTVSCPLSGP